MYSIAEFCAGTGAFSLGFNITKKTSTVYANDVNKNSKIIFDENFDQKLILGDVNNLIIKNIPKMDILTSGFPCQPFSLAGKKLGFEDERTNVFWTLLKIIKYHKPKCVIFENVKNLTSHDSGNTFKTICTSIEKLNYTVKYKILNTCKLTNIPQNRERIYIVCFKNNIDCNEFKFPPNDDEMIEIKDFVLDISKIDDKYYYKNTLKVWDKINNGIVKKIDTNTIYQYRRHYVRENKNNIVPTLTANMGGGGHNVPLLKDNKGIRKLTPKECFKLQGFPDSYILPMKLSDSALYKLAGNAVTVSVIEKIAPLIIKVLDENK